MCKSNSSHEHGIAALPEYSVIYADYVARPNIRDDLLMSPKIMWGEACLEAEIVVVIGGLSRRHR